MALSDDKEFMAAARQLGLTRKRGEHECVYCGSPDIARNVVLCSFPAGPEWRKDEEGGYIGVYACMACGENRISDRTLIVWKPLKVEDGRLIRTGGNKWLARLTTGG